MGSSTPASQRFLSRPTRKYAKRSYGMEKVMSPITHLLKVDEKYFDALETGAKKAEFRRTDRDFQTGDGLDLQSPERDYTTLHFVITHVTHGGQYGIPDGYCVLSIEQLRESD